MYGAWLEKKGMKPTTISTHLAGVGWWHKMQGWEDPSRAYVVQRLLVGLRRIKPAKKQPTPIRKGMLDAILTQLPASGAGGDVKMYKAAFLLAYYASLRVSEYAHTGASQHALEIRDTGFHFDGEDTCVSLLLRSYKGSDKPAKLLVPPAVEGSPCPVQALKAFLKIRPPGPGPLFRTQAGRHLSSRKVNTVLKACARNCGWDHTKFSSHGFRAGRTTDLVEMNLGDSLIRQSGRWRSTAYMTYIRFELFKLPKGAPL